MIQLNEVLTFKTELNEEHVTQNAWEMFFRNGRTIGNELRFLGDHDRVMNMWKDQPCYIVAGGRSMQDFDYIQIDGRHTIGINHMIEFYDRFEVFIALDQKFFDTTTYDMRNYKGLIFTVNKNKVEANTRTILFIQRRDVMQYTIHDGLFKGNLTGLVALNLAIMMGAQPIYLLGMDCGGIAGENNEAHPDGYTGELFNKDTVRKYQETAVEFDNFAGWKNRIFNLSSKSRIDTFKKMTWKQHLTHDYKIIDREPIIFHISNQGDIANLSVIPRYIFKKCYGQHFLFRFKDKLPTNYNPDLFILDHFISTDKDVQTFAQKEKAIVHVHSMSCWPRGNFRRVVALTDVWKKKLLENGTADNITVIQGGINVEDYTNRPKFENKAFGRITRWTPGKINPGWNYFVKSVLEKQPESQNIVFTQLGGKPEPLHGDRITYDVKVKLFYNKDIYLSRLSVYVHANAGFREICPHGIMEAIATGLPVVVLYEDSIAEVLGDTGFLCETMAEIEERTLQLLTDRDLWIEQSRKSLDRAKLFTWQRMCSGWDKLIKECLRNG